MIKGGVTRYYSAGAYARHAELAALAAELVLKVGGRAEVTSGWLTGPQEGLDTGFSVGQLDDVTAPTAWRYAEQDIADVIAADAIVSFTGAGGRGGRHVEHGIAMMLRMTRVPYRGMRLIVVGPREHVFHCHPATEVYPDFDAFLRHETGATQ